MKLKQSHIFYRRMSQSCVILILLFAAAAVNFSQNKWNFEDDGCGATKWGNKNPDTNRGGVFSLQVKEQLLTAPPKGISVDAGKNGGIRIIGWERKEVSVKACVQAWGVDSTEAGARTAAVKIENADGIIRAVSASPATDNPYSYGVSYDIRVPVNTDLKLTTNNGGINLTNISGSIRFDINNGGVILNKIAGSVRGQTNNGDLIFNLSGDKWEGDGIEAHTTNGNVLISLPEKYSVQIAAGTRRGNFYVNLPVEAKRDNDYELSLNLGNGGAIIKASTINGQVTIRAVNTASKESKS